MKMWKENKVCNEWELSNTEIAERFLKSEDYTKYSVYGGFSSALVDSIMRKDGLIWEYCAETIKAWFGSSSIWEWDRTKCSIRRHENE